MKKSTKGSAPASKLWHPGMAISTLHDKKSIRRGKCRREARSATGSELQKKRSETEATVSSMQKKLATKEQGASRVTPMEEDEVSSMEAKGAIR